jgi:hypothetical protein
MFLFAYLRNLWMRPMQNVTSTDEAEPSIQAYFQRMLKAPSDGFIPMTPFINTVPVKQHSIERKGVRRPPWSITHTMESCASRPRSKSA